MAIARGRPVKLAGIALLAAAFLVAFAPLPFASWVWLTIGAQLVLGALLARALVAGERRSSPTDVRTGRRFFAAVACLAIAARVVLATSPHDLSDDAYRYHWDGKQIARRLNPYRYAPDDRAVAALRTEPLDAKINHADLVTVYPPAAQLLFVLAYRLAPHSLLGLHLLTLAAELATWLITWSEIRRLALPWSRLLVIAWLPLVAFQSYLPGHTEALGLPFFALFLASIGRGWSVRGGVALAIAALVKPVPLLVAPAALRALPRAARMRFALAAAITAVALVAPFLSAGGNLVSSARLMARTWRFNASLHPLVTAVAPAAAVRPILALCLAGLVLWSFRASRAFEGRALFATAALLACSPAVYPWYGIWLAPLLVYHLAPAAFAFVALLPLADVVMIGLVMRGEWHPEPWTRWVIYGGTIVVALAWRLSASRRRADGRS